MTLHELVAPFGVSETLVVVAHPDDETFGLGAIIAALTSCRVRVRVLCLTHGETSTLGDTAELATVRARELDAAAPVLGVEAVALLDHPDGHLGDVPDCILDATVSSHMGTADLVVVFEPGGVTGHPDHRAATAAAHRVALRRRLPVLEWGMAPEVARALNDEFTTTFVGTDGIDVAVDREAQLTAIRCHDSQSRNNPVLHRRLERQADTERVRLVVPHADRGDDMAITDFDQEADHVQDIITVGESDAIGAGGPITFS
jgi:LmbE family N-acetylglucosaminyl deacetylase